MIKLLTAATISLATIFGGISLPVASVNAAPVIVRQSGYATSGYAYVTLSNPNSSLRVRSGPSLKDKVLGAVYYGEYVNLLRVSTDSQWFLISTDSGQYGWVNAAYLEFPHH